MDDRQGSGIERAMAEKYFHSRGAASYEEGRFASAVRFFRKALALEDRHYTRLHLGLAYLAKADLGRALAEMTKAVKLAPSEPEYYFQRSAVWRLKGDAGKADEDYSAAIRLDGNYARIEAIRDAARTLQKAFGGAEESGKRHGAEVRGEALRGLLREVDAARSSRKVALEGRSCVVACPAYCCHFRGEPVLHGLAVGPWKLQAIRNFLKSKSAREEDFLTKLPFGQAQERLRLVPPDVVVKDKGQRVVFYPKVADRPISPSLVPALPRSIDYRELAWITAEAKPCEFLDRGRCLIHDLGGEPALPACKEFLCLTGYVFLVFDWLGFPSVRWTALTPMKELNRMAVDALLVLHTRVYGNERLKAMEREMASLLDAAIEADDESKDRLVAENIGRYREVEARYRRLFARQKRLLEKDLRELLKGSFRS